MFEIIFRFGKLIKFSHSIFALPFALVSIILVHYYTPDNVTWPKILWIIIAMVSARSAAMGFNRYADRFIDAKNPRTENREIPKGVITATQTLTFVIISILIFIYSAFMLNPLALYLSPVALLVVLGYSFTKRFTHFSHLYLGLGLGLAPLGAWIALTGEFSIIAGLIAFGVLFWVAGFDVIYACQDFEFDTTEKMFSIPVKLGIKDALLMAKVFHFLAALFFIAVGYTGQLGWIYYLGMVLISIFMIMEHRVVNPQDLSKLDMAFFNLNGIISISYLLIVIFATTIGIG